MHWLVFTMLPIRYVPGSQSSQRGTASLVGIGSLPLAMAIDIELIERQIERERV